MTHLLGNLGVVSRVSLGQHDQGCVAVRHPEGEKPSREAQTCERLPPTSESLRSRWGHRRKILEVRVPLGPFKGQEASVEEFERKSYDSVNVCYVEHRVLDGEPRFHGRHERH